MGETTAEVVLKPSLLAALDVVLKVVGVVTTFLLPAIVSALMSGEPIVIAGTLLGVAAVEFYPAILVAFFPAVQLAFTRYHVDDEGILVHTQILTRSEQRVPWEKVTALRHRRTFIDAVLGIERLDVVAYGTRGTTLRLVGLRDAAPLRDRIAQRMQEGVTLESWLRSD